MKKAIRTTVLAALAVATLANVVSAQTLLTLPTRTTSKMVYHGGPVLLGIQDVYFIWYGCWGTSLCPSSDNKTMNILNDFASTVGNTPYAQINSLYADASGRPASSSFVYGGGVFDSYSQGSVLTEASLAEIINRQFQNFTLPQDPQGIYIIFTSADVTLQDATTQFCLTCCQRHGRTMINGAMTDWGFVGHTGRCPNACGIPSNLGVTPNGDYAGDAMASWLAHTLSEIVTNPDTVSGWYDRYGLENADKCTGTFGTTYLAPNGALANLKLGSRDFLLQQNWVKDGNRGRCGMLPW
jgi:hypothetical protein